MQIEWKKNYKEEIIDSLEEMKSERKQAIEKIKKEYSALAKQYGRARAESELYSTILIKNKDNKEAQELKIKAHEEYNKVTESLTNFEDQNKSKVAKLEFEINEIQAIIDRYRG